MKAEAFLAACVWISAMLVVSTFNMAPPPEPVPANPLDTAPDATVPESPEPQGDCGWWDDTEECET